MQWGGPKGHKLTRRPHTRWAVKRGGILENAGMRFKKMSGTESLGPSSEMVVTSRLSRLVVVALARSLVARRR